MLIIARELNKLGACRAIDIQQVRDGSAIKVAGWVIVRQRPGTAKGFVFLTLEDETGVANIIITPQIFDKNRLAVVDHPFLLIEGTLQNQDNVVSVKAKTNSAAFVQSGRRAIARFSLRMSEARRDDIE